MPKITTVLIITLTLKRFLSERLSQNGLISAYSEYGAISLDQSDPYGPRIYEVTESKRKNRIYNSLFGPIRRAREIAYIDEFINTRDSSFKTSTSNI